MFEHDMERPRYIDISASGSRAASPAGTTRTSTGQPSPRIQHFDGQIPPILSPLDAFAAESRRLAKELEATRIAGVRRMSRLPPQVITESLSQHHANRPACFRSLSAKSIDSVPPLPSIGDSYSSGISPELKEPLQRPKSSYPGISAIEDEDEQHEDVFETPKDHLFLSEPRDYFAIEPTASLQLMSERAVAPPSRSASGNSQTSHLIGLVPPLAPFAKKRHYNESSDDEYTSSNGGSTFSQPRKMSNSSALSFPVSCASKSHHERSPSTKSDTSATSPSRVKGKFNFSRPRSQISLNAKIDSPSRPTYLERKSSHLSEQTRDLTSFEDDRSVRSDGFVTADSSSYTHKKFVLPRGKLSGNAAHRVSQLFLGLSGPTFGWQEPVLPGTPPLSTPNESGLFGVASPTLRSSFDPGRPSLDPGRAPFKRKESDGDQAQASASASGFAFGFERPPSRRSEQQERASPARTNPSPDLTSETSAQRSFISYNGETFDRAKMPTLPTIPGSTADDMSMRSRPTTSTDRSASTIRPTTARTYSDYQALSGDEHVDKAIKLHQNGDLKESTYHLRIAAKQNHPMGMLLYALACRHGWGMRENAREGVALLRKAVDIAMLEIAEDEDAASALPKADFLEKKSHRAQFALGIYELGISHLNGWGVEQDRPLALRCFEIAGNWGDSDALTEAGFCYAEGVGCKKNLKKAAKYYRAAAAQGVSMVGNSWIYKDKYNHDDDRNDRNSRSRKASVAKEEKQRSKSKTRNIFGRKRGKTIAEGNLPSQPKVSIEG